MIFEKALSLLKEGKRVRRTLWNGETRSIRIAQPLREPTLDGPEHVYAVYLKGAPLTEAYESEEDAKKELTQLRKKHTEAWNRYNKFLKEFVTAETAEKERMAHVAAPALPEDHYKEAEVQKRDAPKVGRINVPMLLATARNGAVFPYVLQTPDLLAEDWNEA